MPKVLIVEDEPSIARGLSDTFEVEGFETIIATNGFDGVSMALDQRPDVVLLDVMLPKQSGIDVCRELRQQGFAAPIIMLTARSQEIDKVIGLEIGADDYVTKPFSIKELVARVRAQFRRASKKVVEIDTFSFGEISIDFTSYRATKAGDRLDLSAREFEILRYLARRREETVTRDELLDEVWGYKNNPISRTIDTHIAKLRQKIEQDPSNPRYIVTVHRLGYRFLP